MNTLEQMTLLYELGVFTPINAVPGVARARGRLDRCYVITCFPRGPLATVSGLDRSVDPWMILDVSYF